VWRRISATALLFIACATPDPPSTGTARMDRTATAAGAHRRQGHSGGVAAGEVILAPALSS
jgi:hypothetical protein